jgi:pimeloyl-ACP methyl ester carboxylesterase
LFIIGKDDHAVPLEASLQQCHIPAISHILILDRSGHMGMWEEKEKSTGFLLKFLLEI